jgi:hypothetical protein
MMICDEGSTAETLPWNEPLSSDCEFAENAARPIASRLVSAILRIGFILNSPVTVGPPVLGSSHLGISWEMAVRACGEFALAVGHEKCRRDLREIEEISRISTW